MEHLHHILVQESDLDINNWDSSDFSMNYVLWEYTKYFFNSWWQAIPNFPTGTVQYWVYIFFGIPIGAYWIEIPFEPAYGDQPAYFWRLFPSTLNYFLWGT